MSIAFKDVRLFFVLIVTTAVDCTACPTTLCRSRFVLHGVFLAVVPIFFKPEITNISSNFSNSYGSLLLLVKGLLGKLGMCVTGLVDMTCRQLQAWQADRAANWATAGLQVHPG